MYRCGDRRYVYRWPGEGTLRPNEYPDTNVSFITPTHTSSATQKSVSPTPNATKMAATAEFPAEFLSLEADFVDSKIAINNSISDMLRSRRMHLLSISWLALVQCREH